MHIAIEGNIGAGKTTLSKMLANRLNARIILEEFEDNPFLELYYQEPEKYAFPLEMSFMAQRFLQWQESMMPDLFQPIVVSDYHFYKSVLFASISLEESVLHVYKQLIQKLSDKLREPDIILYLRSPTETLLSNIRDRGRSYEQNIEQKYLEKIESVYSTWLKQQKKSKLIELTVKGNYITDTISLEMIENRIWQEIGGKLN